MTYGGPTWDTAGTLNPNGDNTFDAADATYAGGNTPFTRAWWTFTPTASRYVTINASGTEWVGTAFNLRTEVYQDVTGEDGTGTMLANGNLLNADVSWAALAGVTYHVLIGTFNPDQDETVLTRYHLAATSRAAAHTDWQDTFAAREDNVLVTGFGDLVLENATSEMRTIAGDLYPGEQGPGRRADYGIQETLPGRANGHPAIDSADCSWDHAVFGDIDNQLWNTSTTDADDGGAPFCRLKIPGFADPQGGLQAYFNFHWSDGAPLIAGDTEAEIHCGGHAAWFRRVLTGLMANDPQNWPRGALPLDLADFVADGGPADYSGTMVLEWEEMTLPYERIEATGDINDRPAEGDEPYGITFTFHDNRGPFYFNGEWGDAWLKGAVGQAGGYDDDHPFRVMEYKDGDPVWTHLDEFDGRTWDDLNDSDGPGLPDTLYGTCMTIVLTTGAALNTSSTNGSHMAFRLKFRSPRYRWVYFPETTYNPAPRRIIQRHKDGRVGSGAQTIGRSGGGAARTIGRQL